MWFFFFPFKIVSSAKHGRGKKNGWYLPYRLGNATDSISWVQWHSPLLMVLLASAVKRWREEAVSESGWQLWGLANV